MSLEDLAAPTRERRPRAAQPSSLADTADRLARVAQHAVDAWDDLIAVHGDLPVGDTLADRLAENINALESTARELSALAQRVTHHG